VVLRQRSALSGAPTSTHQETNHPKKYEIIEIGLICSNVVEKSHSCHIMVDDHGSKTMVDSNTADLQKHIRDKIKYHCRDIYHTSTAGKTDLKKTWQPNHACSTTLVMCYL
jgi:hypothetical protein